MAEDVLPRLEAILRAYLERVADRGEYLSLLRWQLQESHRLDQRTTLPGHLTTSALIVSADLRQVLLIDHIVIGRWLQPGGHYEPSPNFHLSARREAVEETGVTAITLHPWHGDGDLPFAIDSHDVPGNPKYGEGPHVHHDLQYLFVADPHSALVPQADEVHAAAWKPVAALEDIAPRVLRRLASLAH